jgi:hypothetical protein
MSVEGSLDLFSLPEILQMISQQGKTGILTVQGQQDIVAISFLTGHIVAADSLAHTVEEGLAKLLLGEGLLSAAELARAMAEHQASGGRLLDVLVERRYLTRPQLLGALRLQTIRQLEALLRWQAGDFKFYGGDEVSYEEGFEPISVEDLLLRTLADFAGPPPPAGQPRPLSAAADARGAAAGVPKPLPTGAGGGAAGERRPAREAKADSGELRLPQVPELPEVPPYSAPREAAPPRTVPSRSPAPPAGGPLATAVAAATAAGAPAQDPTKPPARPAAGAAPWPAGVPPLAPSSPPASVPWPAAALAHPPSAPPVRPRGTASGVVRPQGLPAADGPALVPAATGRAGTLWSPAVVTPDAPPAGQRTRATAPGGSSPEVAAAGPLPKRFRQMQIEEPDRQVPLAHRVAAAGLAVAVAAGLAVAAQLAPERVLLPVPWQQGERAAFVRNQRESLYDKIETAAKTAFLRDGRFPDQLGQLRDFGLLSSSDLTDPGGEPLLYSAREDGYTLQATEGGKPLPDADTSGSISGNFLLDPSVYQNSPQSGPPIVLLD